MPDHVVRMYLEQSVERLTGRTRNIINNALRSAQPAAQPTTSTGLDETPALTGRQTKYSTLKTPRQRKAEAVKSKLDNELRMVNKRRRSGRLIMQKNHQKMCQKAMDTMNTISNFAYCYGLNFLRQWRYCCPSLGIFLFGVAKLHSG